jgi:hypothetical protein
MSPAGIRTGYRHVVALLRRHRVLVVILVGLAAAGPAGRFLAGDINNRGVTGLTITQAGQGDPDELRACSSQKTIFESLNTVDEVHQLYMQEMNAIFTEREMVLKNSDTWTCGINSDSTMPMGMLQSLAARLPGWFVVPEPPSGPAVQRPVTFDAFSAIAGELQREYECKLFELQDRAIAHIMRNDDLSPGQFCCTEQGCAPSGNGSLCIDSPTSDQTCNQACPVYMTQNELAARLPATMEVIAIERQRSRLALDRALQTMRSFDANFPVARELICYQRASLDLRNELNLLADAVSCMPKIWDAITSIHDRKDFP